MGIDPTSKLTTLLHAQLSLHSNKLVLHLHYCRPFTNQSVNLWLHFSSLEQEPVIPKAGPHPQSGAGQFSSSQKSTTL